MTEASIDPRIRARRSEVLRAEGQRRFRRLIVVAAAVIAVGAGWYAFQSPLLDLDRVSVSGAVRTSPSAVEEASGLRPGEPLLSIDAGVVARRVEALPWVLSASVEREWPGTVSIQVRERAPLARVPVGDRFAYLDAEGRVLAIGDDPGVLVELTGLALDGVAPGDLVVDEAATIVELVASLPTEILGPVETVHAEDPGAIRFGLEAGGEVHFGDAAAVAEKVLAIQTVFDRVDLASLDVLDVRVPSAPVVTRR